MKRILALVLTAVILTFSSLVFVGCQGSESKPIVELSFSDYYENALGFEEFAPKLQELYVLLQKAYNGSDKEDIRTFTYDENKYESLTSSLDRIFDYYRADDMTEIAGADQQTKDQYLAMLNAAIIYSGLKSEIASVNLQINSNMLPKENPDWFEHFEEKLENISTSFLEDK